MLKKIFTAIVVCSALAVAAGCGGKNRRTAAVSGEGADQTIQAEVTAVPASLELDPFYGKYTDAGGIAVVSSPRVRDEALLTVRTVILEMLSMRPDILSHMVSRGCRFMVIGEYEDVCDIPEYAHICDTPENIAFWNRRARGFGGAPEHDLSASCGEENILCLKRDRYVGENIMVHEFAHLIHMVGIAELDPEFDERLESLRQSAIAQGLWENTYAITNKEEYFAEAVQSFFDCNRHSEEPNGVHNHVDTREKLRGYDPAIFGLLTEYFPEIELSICR